MGKFRTTQSSFKSGVLSNKLKARIDIDERKDGCEELLNALVMPEGGASRRPGFRFVEDVGTFTEDPILIPFIVSKSVAYQILIDNDALTLGASIRIFKPDGTEITPTDVEVSPITLATGTAAHGYSYAQIADVLILTHSSGLLPPVAVLRTALDTFEIGSFFGGAFTARSIVGTNRMLRIPFDYTNTGSITLTPAATTGITTLTASSALWDSSKDVGRRVKLDIGGTVGVAYITAITSPTVANISVEITLGGTSATTSWSLGTYSDTNFPKTVTSFEQRLIFGGSPEFPDKLLASKVGNIFHFLQTRDIAGIGFTGTAVADDPFSSTPSSNEVNPIQWLSSSQGLEVGTLGGEFISTIEITDSLSYFSFKQQTSYGGADVNAIRVGQSTLYVSRDGKRIREFIFNDDNGSFISRNINILNSDITLFDSTANGRSDIVIEQLVYQRSRDICWAVTSSGKLLGLTYDRQQNLAAWHTHSIGDFVTSVSVIPDEDGAFDSLYVLVNRGTKHFIEKSGQDFLGDSLVITSSDDNDFPWLVDSARKVAATPTLPVTDFQSRTIKVLADGVIYNYDVGASDTTITLPVTPDYAIFGLPYTTIIKTLTFESGGTFGSAHNAIQRIDEISIDFYKSYYAEYGRNASKTYPIKGMNKTTEYTGTHFDKFNPGHQRGDQVFITSDEPVPLIVLGVTAKGVTYDG